MLRVVRSDRWWAIMPALNVSVKQQSATDPSVLPLAFMQIERWANASLYQGWNDIPLASGWTTVNGFQVPQFCVDSLGWVNLRGSCTNVSNAGLLLIATLPFHVPATDWIASVDGTSISGSSFGFLQIDPDGALSYLNNGGGVAAGQIPLNSRFAPFA